MYMTITTAKYPVPWGSDLLEGALAALLVEALSAK